MGSRNWRRVCVVCLLCGTTAIAQTFNSRVSFNGTNGLFPYTISLVQGFDGELYGTTSAGGGYGFGSVFQVLGGTLTTLNSFNSTDGASPYAGLVLATGGNFFGTTNHGGANGYGTIFKITPAGTLTTLHSFASTDGAYPNSALVEASDGNLYGTTQNGGANNICGGGCGTIFKITRAGTLTSLYSFTAGADGSHPFAGLLQATDGKLYGTTFGGTVFKITLQGKLTALHTFQGTDGAGPGPA